LRKLLDTKDCWKQTSLIFVNFLAWDQE
jgi:hypothetical protein